MKTPALLILCVIALEARGQGTPAMQFRMGLASSTTGNVYTVAADYAQPLLFKQIYATGGIYFSEWRPPTEGDPPPAGTAYLPPRYSGFGESRGAALGLQVGEYTFIHPTLSYNFYGAYRSLGWGFAGGLLLHPTRFFALGFSIDYTRLRFDHALDEFGPVECITYSLLFRIKFPGEDQPAAPPAH